MIGRLPIWAMLLPLLAGIAIWGLIWRGHAADLRATLRPLLPAGSEVAISGFPYRLEAAVAPVRLARSGEAIAAELEAERASLHRVPWQKDRQVINFTRSRMRVDFTPFARAWFQVQSELAQASLRLNGARIARLSAVWQSPRIESGLLAVPIAAAQFELHLRETPASLAAAPADPRHPVQAQFVLSGRDMIVAAGSPLGMQMEGEITAKAPLASVSMWRDGGTVEVRNAIFSDASGEVLRASATIVPDGLGGLRLAGTVETVCPANVRAALAGQPPVSEKRLRQPVRLAFAGTLPGDLALPPVDADAPSRPVRGQLPPCPKLR